MKKKRKRFIKNPCRLKFTKEGRLLQSPFYFGKHEGYRIELEPVFLMYWIINDRLNIVRNGDGRDLSDLKRKAKRDLKGLGVIFSVEGRRK